MHNPRDDCRWRSKGSKSHLASASDVGRRAAALDYARAVPHSPLTSHGKTCFPKHLPDKPSVFITGTVMGIRVRTCIAMVRTNQLITDLAVGLSPHDPTRDELSCPRPRSSTPFHHDGPDANVDFLPGIEMTCATITQGQSSNGSYMLLFSHLTLSPSTTL